MAMLNDLPLSESMIAKVHWNRFGKYFASIPRTGNDPNIRGRKVDRRCEMTTETKIECEASWHRGIAGVLPP